MPIKSAGTYMQISDLCSSCSKQIFCGNGMTGYYCTGYAPRVETVSDIKVPPFTDGQKEVIEATERIANGKLICDVDDDIDVLTNEAWLCGLSTEEKAKWLSQRSQILYDCGQRDVFPKIMYEEDWEWWLKEIHNG